MLRRQVDMEVVTPAPRALWDAVAAEDPDAQRARLTATDAKWENEP